MLSEVELHALNIAPLLIEEVLLVDRKHHELPLPLLLYVDDVLVMKLLEDFLDRWLVEIAALFEDFDEFELVDGGDVVVVKLGKQVFELLLFEGFYLLREYFLRGSEGEEGFFLFWFAKKGEEGADPRLFLLVLPLVLLLGGELVLGHQHIPFGEVGDDGLEGRGFEVVESDVADQFLIGDVDLIFALDDEFNDALPPSHHLHLLLGEVETHVVVDQLLL